MSLQQVLEELYGQPDKFLGRVRSELLLHGKTLYQLWKCTRPLPDQSNFYKWFRGERTPPMEQCARLDEALGRLIDGD